MTQSIFFRSTFVNLLCYLCVYLPIRFLSSLILFIHNLCSKIMKKDNKRNPRSLYYSDVLPCSWLLLTGEQIIAVYFILENNNCRRPLLNPLVPFVRCYICSLLRTRCRRYFSYLRTRLLRRRHPRSNVIRQLSPSRFHTFWSRGDNTCLIMTTECEEIIFKHDWSCQQTNSVSIF